MAVVEWWGGGGGRGDNNFLGSTCLLCSAYAYHMSRIVLLTLTRRQMMFNRQKHVGAKCQSAKGTSLYRAPGKKSSTESAGARLWLLLH